MGGSNVRVRAVVATPSDTARAGSPPPRRRLCAFKQGGRLGAARARPDVRSARRALGSTLLTWLRLVAALTDVANKVAAEDTSFLPRNTAIVLKEFREREEAESRYVQAKMSELSDKVG